MSEKTIGYTLLTVGILIMVFAAFQIILVFTNKAKPIQVFNLSSSNIGVPSQTGNSGQLSLPQMSLFSPAALNDSLNLTIHFFLMSFLVTFGYKIANLGVMLIRPVYVKMKVKDIDATAA